MVKKWFGSGDDKKKNEPVDEDTELTRNVNKSALQEDLPTIDADKFRDSAPAEDSGKSAKAAAAATGTGKARLSWPARDENRPQARGSHEQSTSGDDEKTVLFNASKNRQEPAPRMKAAAVDRSSDPVVGWVVVMEGPGKGNSIEIGAGANAIGRGSNQQIQLDFGDDKISRERHAIIVYEPEARQFFVQNGEVRNLTYVGGKVVLGAVELNGGETIKIGDTHLQFVAFCGPGFSWS